MTTLSKKRHICVVVTARPSYSRVKTLLTAIKNHKRLNLSLIVSSSAVLSRYGSVVNVIEKDGFKIDAKVYNVIEGESPTTAPKTTGLAIIEISSIFERLNPDIVVTIADRFETISTAIAASFMNIPLAHIQGGEVTGNIDEKVRHSITKLADYHFVSTENSKKRVIKLGEDQNYVFNTGCPSIDIANSVLENQNQSQLNDIINGIRGVGNNEIDLNKPYLIVMQHPVTTEFSESFSQVNETINAINELDYNCLWFWPNVDNGSDGTSKAIRIARENMMLQKVLFIKNVEPDNFLKLILGSKCIVGNSSVAIRECSFLGVPAVNIGTRQNNRERGDNVIDVGYSSDEIKKAITNCIKYKKKSRSYIFGKGNAGILIAENLSSVNLRFNKTICY